MEDKVRLKMNNASSFAIASTPPPIFDYKRNMLPFRPPPTTQDRFSAIPLRSLTSRVPGYWTGNARKDIPDSFQFLSKVPHAVLVEADTDETFVRKSGTGCVYQVPDQISASPHAYACAPPLAYVYAPPHTRSLALAPGLRPRARDSLAYGGAFTLLHA